jgi:hypothetical protein
MSLADLIGRYGWPRCRKCNKPVDRLLEDRDIRSDEIVITVQCHGETQEVRIDPITFLVPGVEIKFTEAFTDERKQLKGGRH